MISLAYIALAALSAIPSINAAQCLATGSMNTNTVYMGGAVANPETVVITRDGKKVGEFTPGQFQDPICQHTHGIDSELPYVVEYTASCGTLDFRSCSVNYAGEIGIKGTVHNGNDFYGIGIDSTSQCQVAFSC